MKEVTVELSLSMSQAIWLNLFMEIVKTNDFHRRDKEMAEAIGYMTQIAYKGAKYRVSIAPPEKLSPLMERK